MIRSTAEFRRSAQEESRVHRSWLGISYDWFRLRFPTPALFLERAFFGLGIRKQQEEVANLVIGQTGRIVLSGPFVGMELPAKVSWCASDILYPQYWRRALGRVRGLYQHTLI